MERLAADREWSLFDPINVPALLNVYGEEFARLYVDYERTVEPVFGHLQDFATID